MSKNKNVRIYSTNIEWLEMLADENKNYIGRDFKLDKANGVLTIFALPQRRKRKPPVEKRERSKQNERFERK